MQLNMMHESLGGTIICKELKACSFSDGVTANLTRKELR
jgi:hypothetical protein